MEYELKETIEAYEELSATCEALYELSNKYSYYMNDNEFEHLGAVMESLCNRRAALKSRLNMLKHYGI